MGSRFKVKNKPSKRIYRKKKIQIQLQLQIQIQLYNSCRYRYKYSCKTLEESLIVAA